MPRAHTIWPPSLKAAKASGDWVAWVTATAGQQIRTADNQLLPRSPLIVANLEGPRLQVICDSVGVAAASWITPGGDCAYQPKAFDVTEQVSQNNLLCLAENRIETCATTDSSTAVCSA